jgi:plasmid stabilization system protein ParE
MRVRFTPPAQADLRQIHARVSKDNPAEASRLVARLIERASAGRYALRGPLSWEFAVEGPVT